VPDKPPCDENDCAGNIKFLTKNVDAIERRVDKLELKVDDGFKRIEDKVENTHKTMMIEFKDMRRETKEELKGMDTKMFHLDKQVRDLLWKVGVIVGFLSTGIYGAFQLM